MKQTRKEDMQKMSQNALWWTGRGGIIYAGPDIA